VIVWYTIDVGGGKMASGEVKVNKTRSMITMIKKIRNGNEYIFNYRHKASDAVDDMQLCNLNSGLRCTVVDDVYVEDEHGKLYEVRSITGSEFLAYDSELDEV
jgi:hypothetical protein